MQKLPTWAEKGAAAFHRQLVKVTSQSEYGNDLRVSVGGLG